jgi:hypothetical protein
MECQGGRADTQDNNGSAGLHKLNAALDGTRRTGGFDHDVVAFARLTDTEAFTDLVLMWMARFERDVACTLRLRSHGGELADGTSTDHGDCRLGRRAAHSHTVPCH